METSFSPIQAFSYSPIKVWIMGMLFWLIRYSGATTNSVIINSFIRFIFPPGFIMQLFHAYAIGVQKAEITSGQLNLVWPSGLQMHDDMYARPEVQATHKILKNTKLV